MTEFSFEIIRDFDRYPLSEKLKLAETGIGKNQLKQLCDVLELPLGILAGILDVHERTLYIKKSFELCNRNITNEIFGIIEMYTKAYNLFSSQASANNWMKRKRHIFEGKTPLDLAHTFPGRQAVKDELLRLEYGIFG